VGGSLVRGRLVAERRGCDVKTKKKNRKLQNKIRAKRLGSFFTYTRFV
jgi:hypothetical protein